MPVITATDAAANGLSDFSESVIMMIAPARDPMIRPAAANLKFHDSISFKSIGAFQALEPETVTPDLAQPAGVVSRWSLPARPSSFWAAGPLAAHGLKVIGSWCQTPASPGPAC